MTSFSLQTLADLPTGVLPSTSSNGDTYFIVVIALAVGLAVAVLMIFILVAILVVISKQLRHTRYCPFLTFISILSFLKLIVNCLLQCRSQLKQASLANPVYDIPEWPDNVEASKTGSNSGTSGKGATMSPCAESSKADDVLTQDNGKPENNYS